MNHLHMFIKTLILTLLVVTGSGFAQEKGKAQAKKETTATTSATNPNAININTADATKLDELPRVGPAIAKRIVAHREEHGGFKKLEELMNVKGIGPKTFEKLKEKITL